MRVVVVEPPAPVVTWEEADKHLKLDGDTSQQEEVEGFIAAATGHLDVEFGWLGRAIGVQTLEARFDIFTGQVIALPFPPVIELVSIQYLGRDGVLRTADNADFELFDGMLEPAGSSWAWEGGSTRRNAVRVRYRAGYPALPPPIRAAILLMVGDLYRNRETTPPENVRPGKIPMSTTVDNLLEPIRIYT